jgi:hypothetical protein
MADLTVNGLRDTHGPYRQISYDVGANLEVFAGQLMMTGAGGIVNSDGGAVTDDLVGFALEYADNRTSAPSGGAARAIKCQCLVEGYVWLTVTNAGAFTHDDVGLPVYNDADANTFNLVVTTNSKVGVIVNCDAAVAAAATTAEVLVYFNVATAHLLA